jgi:hypothetical protein
MMCVEVVDYVNGRDGVGVQVEDGGSRVQAN